MIKNSFFVKNSLKLNETGINFKNDIKNLIKEHTRIFFNLNYDYFEILNLCNLAINEISQEHQDYINEFIKSEKYKEIYELEIFEKSTNQRKIAKFEGYIENGKRIWKFEENYIPHIPYEIIELDSKTFYSILK